ncbi:SDR family NAD(P)-dependent oxidoreductase [Sphingomonas phyllosphaerae]|uniref:SDR family NAD(P)-dependent oxidoreductase n=1 Tax=Sphingomonas phyllosphaerae TaxID=257003 RepID=UPI00042A0CF2|nr:SDR family oxidoreductase [Sphingomonas phyllosphaerae]
MTKLLEGKTAIITGATEGIGRATAELFLRHGANVVATGRRQEKLDQLVTDLGRSGGRIIGVNADSSDPLAPKLTFIKAVEAFGRVDILVNNAGMGEMMAIEETTDEHFDKVVQANFGSVFRHCREAVQHFMPRGEGAIVNVTSINGSLPLCGLAYTSTKGAVNTMTKSIAVRFTGTGIRCNAVAPGFVDTPMTKKARGGEMDEGSMFPFNEIYGNTDIKDTTADEQANAILFFASDMSKAVTGRVLVVDNGTFMAA